MCCTCTGFNFGRETVHGTGLLSSDFLSRLRSERVNGWEEWSGLDLEEWM